MRRGGGIGCGGAEAANGACGGQSYAILKLRQALQARWSAVKLTTRLRPCSLAAYKA